MTPNNHWHPHLCSCDACRAVQLSKISQEIVNRCECEIYETCEKCKPQKEKKFVLNFQEQQKTFNLICQNCRNRYWSDQLLDSWICDSCKGKLNNMNTQQNIPPGCLPFDLEKAKAGAKLRNRYGDLVEFVYFNDKIELHKVGHRNGPYIHFNHIDGTCSYGDIQHDLFLVAEPRYIPHTFETCPRAGWIRVKGERDAVLIKSVGPAHVNGSGFQVSMLELEYSANGIDGWKPFGQEVV